MARKASSKPESSNSTATIGIGPLFDQLFYNLRIPASFSFPAKIKNAGATCTKSRALATLRDTLLPKLLSGAIPIGI